MTLGENRQFLGALGTGDVGDSLCTKVYGQEVVLKFIGFDQKNFLLWKKKNYYFMQISFQSLFSFVLLSLVISAFTFKRGVSSHFCGYKSFVLTMPLIIFK